MLSSARDSLGRGQGVTSWLWTPRVLLGPALPQGSATPRALHAAPPEGGGQGGRGWPWTGPEGHGPRGAFQRQVEEWDREPGLRGRLWEEKEGKG